MALSGIQIYKLLPQTNCKECGFPTCLAFAMKLAAKQVELASCPYVSEDSKAQLVESSAPPIRLVSLRADGQEVKSGNEVVLYRHEKTFYNKPGLFLRLRDDRPPEEIRAAVAAAEAFAITYVGMNLKLDGFAVEATLGDAGRFVSALTEVRRVSRLPLILMAADPAVLAAGLSCLPGEAPLLYATTAAEWEQLAELARQHKAPLAVAAPTLEELAGLTEKVRACGVEDLVLVPTAHDLCSGLANATLIRRLAIKKNFRPLGFPVLVLAGEGNRAPWQEAIVATQAIAKYAGLIVLDHFIPELLYPLLVLRQNIYTDPQKPIQVQPGLYEINSPKPSDPLLVTTNFSITYFSVANEIEGSGLPAWLLVADAEGMSVLTAWAAGKFDADRIAKGVKQFNVAEKVSRKQIVLPGHVAVLSGEVEEALPGWEVRVGPREAVDIPAYMKKVLLAE